MSALSYSLYVWGDMHIGSGVGVPGYIDERVVRDEQGLVFVPASEVKGLIRQSCADLVYFRGQQATLCAGQRKWQRLESGEPAFVDFCDPETESCMLCILFGSPRREGALWFSPARYQEEYRQSLEAFTATGLAERDSTTSAHASIDPYTRRASEHQLFNLEIARPVTHFIGTVEEIRALQPARLAEDELRAWTQASLLFTRRLGGRRRRGWGYGRFVLDDHPLAELRAWLGGKNDHPQSAG